MEVAEAALSRLLGARRILVLGSPGSGKTYLSTILGRNLGLPVQHLDDFFWKPGPVRLPTGVWRERVVELTSRPEWIMDGTYEASLDLRLPSAEAMVYIRCNRWACLWRVTQRRLLGRRTPLDESTHGHALTAFFLRYIFRFPSVTEPEVLGLIARLAPGKPLLMFHGSRAVNRFIRRLEHRPSPTGLNTSFVAQTRTVETPRNGRA